MQEAGITISNSDLKRLLACANGDAALLYLYLAAGNEPELAGQALRMPKTRLTLRRQACGSWGSARRKSRSIWPPPKRRAIQKKT